MTRTDPPNPASGPARPLLTEADRQALTDHLTDVAGRANIAILALTRDIDVQPDRALAACQDALNAARRAWHGDDDTAALATAGVLAPIGDDVEACGEAYALSGPGDEYDGEGMQAALALFAGRLAERLPATRPAALGADDQEAIAAVLAFGPHSGPLHSLADTASDVIDTVNQLLAGRTPTHPAQPAQIDGPTSTETARLVTLWDKLPDISRTAIVTSLLTMFVAHRNGSDALSALNAGHGLPVVGQGETTGPDGDECSQDCPCRR